MSLLDFEKFDVAVLGPHQGVGIAGLLEGSMGGCPCLAFPASTACDVTQLMAPFCLALNLSDVIF